MSHTTKLNAIVIVTNGEKQIINLNNLQSLSITLTDQILDVQYIENVQQSIPIGPPKQLTAPETDITDTEDGAEKIIHKNYDEFKYKPAYVKNIPISDMVKIYNEYKTAVKVFEGSKVLDKWCDKYKVKRNSLSVWMTYIKRAKEGDPAEKTPTKAFEIARLIS